MRFKFEKYQWVAAIVLTLFFACAAAFYFKSYKGTDSYILNFEALQTTEVEEGLKYEFAGMSLPEGRYALDIAYKSNNPCSFGALIDNDINIFEELPATGDSGSDVVYNFKLTEPTDKGRLTFISPVDDPVMLMQIKIINLAGDHIYSDGLIWGIMALVMIPLCWLGVFFFGRSTHKMALLSTVFMTVAMILPFILVRIGVMGIDSKAHMMRVEGIYNGILDHQFPVVVYPEWNNSYGQIGVLYPDIFLYIPAIFRLLGMSQLGTLKLFMCILCILSGIIAFASARSVFRDDWQITICTAVCMLGDMHLHDLYYGGKFGGSYLADMIWPLLVAGLYHIFYGNKKKWYCVAIALAALFSSHVTSASVGCIAIVVLTLACYRTWHNKEVWQAVLKAVLLFLVLIIGPIVSFIQFYFGDWGQETLQWSNFYLACWGFKSEMFADQRYVSVIVVMIVTGILIVICKFRRDSIQRKTMYIFPFFITGVFLFWMSTQYFPWKILLKIPAIEYYTNMLQSGYRFLPLCGSFFAFVLTGVLKVCVSHYKDRKWYRSIRVGITYAVVSLFMFYNFFHEALIFTDDEMATMFYDEVLGEVEVNMEDYLPEGTKTEWYSSDAGVISDESAVTAHEYSREGTHILFTYENSGDDVYVEFPKFYYEGYRARNALGLPMKIEKGDHNRIRLYLEKSNPGEIKEAHIKYSVPMMFTILYIVTLLTWAVVSLGLFMKVYKRMK